MANIKESERSHDYYYPLDNSAVYIASVTGRSSPLVYRISCELDDYIHLPDLEAALAATAERFPFIKTRLRRGFFWYYLDPVSKPLRVYPDSVYPTRFKRGGIAERYLFRVFAYATRVSVEFHHILTDGTGAIEFVRSLVAAYLQRRGVELADWGDIKRPGSPIKPEELADAYAGLTDRGIPLPEKFKPAWHLGGSRFRDDRLRITVGTLALDAALAASKARGVSLTVLLSAVYLASLQELCELEHGYGGKTPFKPIRIQVPVNLRRFFPSTSLRNFFLFIPIELDRRLGHFNFDELLDRVNYTLKLSLTVKELSKQLRRNTRGEEYMISRIVPLFVKDIALRAIGRRAADAAFSGNLSNLSAVYMPEAFARHIRRFDVLQPRKPALGANIGVISWGNALSVTVGSLIEDRSFERLFFTRIADLGVPLTVESNF